MSEDIKKENGDSSELKKRKRGEGDEEKKEKRHKEKKEKDRDHKDKDRKDKDKKEKDKERDRDRDRRDSRDRDREKDRRHKDKDRDERDKRDKRDKKDKRDKDKEKDKHKEKKERKEKKDKKDKDKKEKKEEKDKEVKEEKKKKTDDITEAETAKEDAEQQKREAEKQSEQDKLEEEMRKRRERVESWRKERQQVPTVITPTDSETPADTTAEPVKTWTLDDDDDEDEAEKSNRQAAELKEEVTPSEIKAENREQPMKEAVAESSAGIVKKEQEAAPVKMEEEPVDPLDAYMFGINQEVRKLHTIQVSKVVADEQGKKTLTVEDKKTNTEKKETPKAENGKQTKATAKAGNEIYFSDNDDEEIDEDMLSAEEVEEENDDELVPRPIGKKKQLAVVDHSKIQYQPFTKNFYVETQEVSMMTKEEVAALRKQLDSIQIRGKNCPKPVKTFAQCGLVEKIHDVLKRHGFEKPTPIQSQAIPAIMSGRDVIGIAKTGSGKTLAFLLPMLRHIIDQPPLVQGEGSIGLVMVPTRELAIQIQAEFKKFAKATGLKCICVYGGTGVAQQIGDLKRGTEIIVCTPGRMIDVLCANNGRITNLRRVTYLVLDEADRMFDMGFEPQITRIIDNIRPDRQTVMFSATFPKQVEMAARRILNKPLEILVGGRSVVCESITQIVEIRAEDTKFRRLLEILGEWYERGSILIFVDRQESVDSLFRELLKAGYVCLTLHGGKDQSDRDDTISSFKDKSRTILIATSVAARGLDVRGLNLVINYEVPNHIEDYVHRVGRTGRAGNKGTAITFLCPDEDKFAPDIVRALKMSNVEVIPELQKMADEFLKKKSDGSVQGHGSGYGGKGYKFDEKEELARLEERKRQKRAYNLDVEDSSSENDSDDDEAALSVATAAAAQAAANISKALQQPADGTAAPTIATAPTPPAAPTTTATATTPKAPAKTPSQHEAQQKAAAFAASLNQKIKPILGAKAHFDAELEINDFPQQARWKVTHKDALASITEWTGAAITTRGVHVPLGRNPQPGERKLFLYIEGPTEDSVKKAKSEIKRILEEVSLTCYPEKSQYAKYSVL